MYCPDCGTAAPDAQAFCYGCGANMRVQTVAPVPYAHAGPYAGAAATIMPAPATAYSQPVYSAPNPTYVVQMPNYDYGQPAVLYGDFFARFFALFIDELIAFSLAGVVYGVIFALSMAAGAAVGGGEGAVLAAFVAMFLGGAVSILTYVIYFVKLETGSGQATLGKRMLGLKIVNSQGAPISVGQSLGRLLIKATFSALFFCLGFIIAAFTDKKQALHDFVASTYVVKA